MGWLAERRYNGYIHAGWLGQSWFGTGQQYFQVGDPDVRIRLERHFVFADDRIELARDIIVAG